MPWWKHGCCKHMKYSLCQVHSFPPPFREMQAFKRLWNCFAFTWDFCPMLPICKNINEIIFYQYLLTHFSMRNYWLCINAKMTRAWNWSKHQLSKFGEQPLMAKVMFFSNFFWITLFPFISKFKHVKMCANHKSAKWMVNIIIMSTCLLGEA